MSDKGTEGPAALPPRRGPLGLSRTFLLSLVGLFLLFGTSVWVVAVWTGYDQALAEARARARLLSHVVNEHFSWTIKGSDLVLRQAAAMVAQLELRSLFASDEARGKLNAMAATLPQIGALWFIDEQGRAVYSTRRGPMPPLDYSDTDYFEAHRGGTDFFITPATKGTVSNIVFFSTSRRLEHDGAFAGAVIASIDMSYFAQFHQGLGIPASTALELFTDGGRLVVRWPVDVGMVGRDYSQSWFFRRLKSDEGGGGDLEGPAIADDRPAIMAYQRIAGLPLLAIATIDRHAALETWRSHAIVGFILMVIGYAVIGALTMFGLRTFRRETLAQEALSRRSVELEQALEARTLLFKEMHHRTKNNLQIVSSLLSLQASQAQDRRLRQAFNDTVTRIQAMARLHEQLYLGGDIAAVDCGAYVRTISESLVDEGKAASRVALSLDVDPVTLSMDKAVPLALITNELLTNAMKHGLPQGRTGTIAVSLKSSAGQVVLTVRDDGVGCTWEDAPQRAGSLGMQLIRGLSSQLKGTVSFKGALGQGTTATVSFPLPR